MQEGLSAGVTAPQLTQYWREQMNTKEKMFRIRNKAAAIRYKRRRAKSEAIRERLKAEADFWDDVADDLQELLIIKQKAI